MGKVCWIFVPFSELSTLFEWTAHSNVTFFGKKSRARGCAGLEKGETLSPIEYDTAKNFHEPKLADPSTFSLSHLNPPTLPYNRMQHPKYITDLHGECRY